MAQTLETYPLDLEMDAFFDPTALKDLITETIMQNNQQIADCVISFSYVAIQRFLSHCKNHSLDPLEVPQTDIQDFIDQCLKKELFYEITKPLTATTPPG